MPDWRLSLQTHAVTTVGAIHGRVGGGMAVRAGYGDPLFSEHPAIQESMLNERKDEPW